MTRIGRPTLLTPKRHQQIVDALRAGAYANVACRTAGVAESTYYAWLERGRAEADRIADAQDTHDAYQQGLPKRRTKAHKTRLATLAKPLDPQPDEAPYLDFLEATARASDEAEVAAVAQLRQAAGEDWRAAAWFLERRHPDRWRRRETTEHTGSSETPMAVAIVGGDGVPRDHQHAPAAHAFLEAVDAGQAGPAPADGG